MTDLEIPTLPVPVGELIAEKYRVDRILGAGGMGVVVAATHLDLDRQVAVKLIREELAEDESIVARMMLEARSAAKIRSDHVGRVLDVGKLPSGAPYIVMEYLEGADVCKVLETQGALPVVEAIDYLLQACEALAEAHAANIVHRDLKPENLFMATRPDGSARIKVLDFGISKQLGDPGRRALTNPATAVGSPHYMAPEQMQANQVDLRADIWALGTILYELVSNHRAFEGDTLPAVCAKVLSQAPDPILVHAPHVPDRLVEVIERCLQKDPAERFQSIAQLADALVPFGSDSARESSRRISALVAGSPSANTQQVRSRAAAAAPTAAATTPGHGVSLSISSDGTPSGSQAMVQPGQRSRTTLAPAAAAVAVLLVLGGGAWLWANNGDPDDTTAQAANTVPTPTASAPTARPALGNSNVAALPDSAEAASTDEDTDAGSDRAPSPAVAPAVTSNAGATASNPPPLKKTRPKPARAKGVPKAKTKPKADSEPKNPWDTDTFGGRH